MNGIHNFVVNWYCGCAISEKAIQELKPETCHGCGGVFDVANLITLYPNAELFNVYEQRIAEERVLKLKAKKERVDIPSTSNAVLSASTSQRANFKKTKPNSENEKTNVVDSTREAVKRKAGRSLQDDPNIPNSVKSMFTSSEEAKKQPKAHWVTHNPLYF